MLSLNGSLPVGEISGEAGTVADRVTTLERIPPVPVPAVMFVASWSTVSLRSSSASAAGVSCAIHPYSGAPAANIVAGTSTQ